MTIEELFGTLQQSVVTGWRKHLKTHKYSKHMALDEFYNEMPEKVDALIEAWMGSNGKKVNSFTNIITSKNMGTLVYLKELRKVVKRGYSLMRGEKELEALMDDIVELIDSTLYKVKELSESRIVDLKDFLTESLVNESFWLDSCYEYPNNWDLVDIFDETDGGSAAKLKQYDWTNYFNADFVDENGKDIIKLFTNFFAACDSVRNTDVGNVGEDEFNDEEIRDYADISKNECGVALHKEGDDGTWTIITFKKPIKKLPKPQQTAILDLMTKYSDSNWYYIEYFDTI